MKRKKEMVILCHCILNGNAKVEGISSYSGAIESVVSFFIQKGVGIIQLPCPEMTMYGIRRWGHVKEQFDTPYFRRHCKEIFQPYLEQIKDYTKNGYTILGLIGLEGSPSCGVSETCAGYWGGEIMDASNIQNKMNTLKMVQDPGVFIEEIKKELLSEGINIPLIGINEMKPDNSFEKIKNILKECKSYENVK